MKSTTCDICGEEATVTYEVYGHRPGYRPIFGLHDQTLRMAGKFVDLCAEHSESIAEVLTKSVRTSEDTKA